ncbi:Hypothetical protein BN2458_PEG1196 [Helicobacter typhlonius]|uniref:Uncharacterized protein n=1 Tax=Helicobacter typhlonius TaxID=76936 RepID=A0A0S4PVK2_9HELI|nr:Hypothetical protein BN2458_PEG1196 [Helicobacter typhlonius]
MLKTLLGSATFSTLTFYLALSATIAHILNFGAKNENTT